MYKKFVPLNSDKSPSTNPYKVRTFLGEPLKPQHPEWRTDTCGYNRNCDAAAVPQNSPSAKVLTLEDEIRKLSRKTQENLYQRPFQKTCQYEDRFVTCVKPQRTPYELKRSAIMREKFLKTKQEMQEFQHDAGDLYLDHESLIKLNEPLEGQDGGEENEEDYVMEDTEGVVKPEIASPECSMDYIYVPPKRLLELKRPKSGLFVNETQPPNFYPSDDIPYSSYNPRVLQEQFDAQYLKTIDVIPGKNSKDLFTWNVGVQQKESDLERELIEAVIPKFDCNNLDLVAYKIPDDLEKTFSAGIVFGTKAVTPETPSRKKSHFNRPLEIACIYLAYVEGFRLNADFWTAQTMNNIIKMAEKLIGKSAKMNYKSPDTYYDIIPQITERQATVNIKIHFTGPLKNEPNIYKALTQYFSKYNACILCSNQLYLLIWKRCKNFFYIYDPNGRMENCERDFEKGKCALMSTHFVEHLVHLIVNISRAQMEDEFNLYEIYLTSYGKIPNPLPKTPFPKNFHKIWSVVNDYYAVIPGCNNGIFQPSTSREDNASMLISVMAILYHHIERANGWKMEQIDELIRLGTAYYKSLRRRLKLKERQHVTITDLPDKYVLGTFKASLKKAPFLYTGTVTDYCKRYQDSLLTAGLKELFDGNFDAGLLQIDNSVVAVWKDRELYYVYDPFRRGKAGQVLDPEDYKTNGTAMLQMHSNFDSFTRMLYQNALKMRRGGKFFLHALNVGCIKPIMDGKPRKLRYPKLKLTPETYAKEKNLEDEEMVSVDEEKKDEDQEKLKVMKAKKVKNNKKLPGKVCSLQSLAATERLPSYNDSEVVEGLLDNIICEIINELPESIEGRPHLYKQAERVLLKSDKEYLENLQYLVQHDQDFDNVDVIYRTEPDSKTPLMTLEEELEIPSNFQSLPDGSWIIFGNLAIEHINKEQTKLRGLLSAIVTVALTAKFKISTWSSNLIDYSVNASENFGKDFQTYQYALGAVVHKRIPKLAIGEKTFEVKVQQILKTNPRKSLRQVLLEALINFNRLLIICQRYSCLLVKRYNFLYMFNAFPNNNVGYRKCNTGPASLLRFIELDALIRRIEFGCNPQGCDIIQYVVIPVKVRDITPESLGRYKQWPDKVENHLVKTVLEERKREEEGKRSKLQFLQEELYKESLRIKEFQEDKGSKVGERAKELTRSKRAKNSQQQSREQGGEDSNEELKRPSYSQQSSSYYTTEDNVIYDRLKGGEDSNDESTEGKEENEGRAMNKFGNEISKYRNERLCRKTADRKEKLFLTERSSFDQPKGKEKSPTNSNSRASYTNRSRSSLTTKSTLSSQRHNRSDSDEDREENEEIEENVFGAEKRNECFSRRFVESDEKTVRSNRECFRQTKGKVKDRTDSRNPTSYSHESRRYCSEDSLMYAQQLGDEDSSEGREEPKVRSVSPQQELVTQISKSRDKFLSSKPTAKNDKLALPERGSSVQQKSRKRGEETERRASCIQQSRTYLTTKNAVRMDEEGSNDDSDEVGKKEEQCSVSHKQEFSTHITKSRNEIHKFQERKETLARSFDSSEGRKEPISPQQEPVTQISKSRDKFLSSKPTARNEKLALPEKRGSAQQKSRKRGEKTERRRASCIQQSRTYLTTKNAVRMNGEDSSDDSDEVGEGEEQCMVLHKQEFGTHITKSRNDTHKFPVRVETLARSKNAHYCRQNIRGRAGQHFNKQESYISRGRNNFTTKSMSNSERHISGKDSNYNSDEVGKEKETCFASPKQEFGARILKAREGGLSLKFAERECYSRQKRRGRNIQNSYYHKGDSYCTSEKEFVGEDCNVGSDEVEGKKTQECFVSPNQEFKTQISKSRVECLSRQFSEKEENIDLSKRAIFNRQERKEKGSKQARYTHEYSSYLITKTMPNNSNQIGDEYFNDDSDEVEEDEECFASPQLEFGTQKAKNRDECVCRKLSERVERLARSLRASLKHQLGVKNFGKTSFNRTNYTHPSSNSTSENTLTYNRQLGGQDSQDDLEEVEEVGEEEEECVVLPRHEIGTEIPKARDDCLRPRPLLYGYRMREKDLLYKIQGSKAIEGRDICDMAKIKPCFFASSIAILSAILKPLNEWTSQRVDQVIDSSLILSEAIEDMSSSYERILKNLSIDDYKFKLWIKHYQPIGLIGDLPKQLERVTSQRKHIILQTANCSYAIFKDEYYHLFDAYPSMELTNMKSNPPQDEEEEVSQKLSKPPKDVKVYGERNTASWILFADADSLVKYLDQRSCSSSWKEDNAYNFQVLEIISYKKSSQNSMVLQLLTDMGSFSKRGEPANSICAQNESMDWLQYCLPIWSRLNRRNSSGRYRNMAVTKLKQYDIEIDKRLWSLWGNLHPQAPVFDSSSRGKQYFACCVLSLCAARLYHLTDWSFQLLDSIIINGDLYFRQSIQHIKCIDHQFTLEDLNRECYLDNIKFMVHVEAVAYGILYSRPNYKRMNLSEALMYFFNHHNFGIVQCFRKCLAIGYVPGHDGGYFMFDCQSRDHPLFPKSQGASYVLLTKSLQILLYCIVVTLNIPYYNVEFTLHKVDMLYEGQSVEEQEQSPQKSQEG